MTIQSMFNQVAPTYDTLNRYLSFKTDRRWRKSAIDAITGKLDFRVLDLCAGTLDMTITLLRRFPHAHVTCVDFSPDMLELGRAKLPHVFHPHVDIRCEDALQLSLPSSSIDVAMCAFGMRNLPDQDRALEQIQRVLAPGGELVILEFFQPLTLVARVFAKTYGKFIIPWLGGLLSKQPDAYQYLHRSTENFYPLPAYRALLRQHGFTVRSARNLSGGVANLVVAVKG